MTTPTEIASALSVDSTAIRQIDGLYSLNDLHKASGRRAKHRPHQFLRSSQTTDLIDEISKCADSRITPIRRTRGSGGGTYACEELVYAYAMWISPKFHLHVIRAFDALQQAPRQSLPAGPPPLPDDVRRAIDRKAHALSLRAFEYNRDYLEKWVRKHQDWDPELALERIHALDLDLDHGQYVAINVQHLWDVTSRIMAAKVVIESVVSEIHKLEQSTGREWYGRG